MNTMYKLFFKLDYKWPNGKSPYGITADQDLMMQYISFAQGQKAGQAGVERTVRRTLAHLENKFDAAKDTNLDFILLDNTEKELVEESFRDIKPAANESRAVTIAEDEVLKLNGPDRQVDMTAVSTAPATPVLQPVEEVAHA